MSTISQFIQAKHFYNGGNHPRLIVIHDMEYPKKDGTAVWCGKFFAGLLGGEAPHSSAHYGIDNREIVQYVREEDGAWHAPGYLAGQEVNRISIGIEHAGYARQSPGEWQDSYSGPMMQMSAQLVAELCNRYGIPAKRLTLDELRAGESGICGHVDITRASGSGTHTDPGDGFPWDWYMGLVNANLAPPSRPGSLAAVSSRLPLLLLGLTVLGMVGAASYMVLGWKPQYARWA